MSQGNIHPFGNNLALMSTATIPHRRSRHLMDIRAVTEGALNLAERFNNFRQADLNGRIGQRLDRAQDMIESGDL